MKLIKRFAATIVLFLGGCAVQGGREDQAIQLKLSPDRTLLKLFNRTNVILHTDDLFVRYATVGASQLRLVAFDNLGRNVPVCGPIVYEHPPKSIDVTPNSEIILPLDVPTIRGAYCLGSGKYSIMAEYVVKNGSGYRSIFVSNRLELPE